MPICSKYIVLRKVNFSLDIGFRFLICLIQRFPASVSGFAGGNRLVVERMSKWRAREGRGEKGEEGEIE